MASQEIDQYSVGKLWNNLVYQFFSLMTTSSILPEFIMLIQDSLPNSTRNSSAGKP